jgi:hypothetical protein
LKAAKALENQRRQAFSSSPKYKGKPRSADTPANSARHRPLPIARGIDPDGRRVRDCGAGRLPIPR